jgi:hypothetical protein
MFAARALSQRASERETPRRPEREREKSQQHSRTPGCEQPLSKAAPARGWRIKFLWMCVEWKLAFLYCAARRTETLYIMHLFSHKQASMLTQGLRLGALARWCFFFWKLKAFVISHAHAKELFSSADKHEGCMPIKKLELGSTNGCMHLSRAARYKVIYAPVKMEMNSLHL